MNKLAFLLIVLFAADAFSQESKVPRCDPPENDKLRLSSSDAPMTSTVVTPAAQPRSPWDSRVISAEAPDGYTPPKPTYDDSGYVPKPVPRAEFYEKKSKPKEKTYPHWEINYRGEEVYWVAPDEYYIREKDPDQQAAEDAFYAKLGRDFVEAAGEQSNIGQRKLLSELKIYKEGMHRRVYLNRLFRMIKDYEESTLPN